jgi:hypothetical protein
MKRPKSALRIALAIAAAIVVVMVARVMLWIPLRCNERIMSLEDSSLAAFETSELSASMRIAQANIEECRRCLRYDRGNVRFLMVLAANQQALRRYDAAMVTYQEALKYDKRPELYLQLGLVEAQLGLVDLARAHIAAAARFKGEFLYAVTDGYLRDQVAGIISNDWVGQGNLLAPFRPYKKKEVASSGIGLGAESATRLWRFYGGSPGETITRTVTAQIDGENRPAMHVTTTCKQCGVLQDWAAQNTGPAHVITEIAIEVKRGTVVVSTGNVGRPLPDTTLGPAPGWQRVKIANKGCPANRTLIYSDTAPAEFTIAEVTVTAVAGPPCNDSPNG